MSEAFIAIAATLLLALLGFVWRLSSKIESLTAGVRTLNERFNRVEPEKIDKRVARLEALEEARQEAS